MGARVEATVQKARDIATQQGFDLSVLNDVNQAPAPPRRASLSSDFQDDHAAKQSMPCRHSFPRYLCVLVLLRCRCSFECNFSHAIGSQIQRVADCVSEFSLFRECKWPS